MTERDSPDSPWIQAGRLTFLALYAVTVLAALAWAPPATGDGAVGRGGGYIGWRLPRTAHLRA